MEQVTTVAENNFIIIW